jgi:hypothetical protein
MERSLEWHFWSAEQIVEALPDLIATVESRLAEFPDEHREKNAGAAQSLTAEPPTPAQLRDGSRSRDVATSPRASASSRRPTSCSGAGTRSCAPPSRCGRR